MKSGKKISALDIYIQREEPFKKIKINEAEAKKDVAQLLSHLLRMSYELEPVFTDISLIIREAVLTNKKPDNLFPRLEA